MKFARNGMVATSQPLAAQAGLEIIRNGGNAVDAAVATAACLTVVEPTSNGIGGDAFALVWKKDRLSGLNSSGPAPEKITIDKIKQRGFNEIPETGWIPVTVPGVPAAWASLVSKHGRLTLKEVLQPAIDYASNGYPVSPTTGKYWKYAFRKYKKTLKGEEFKEWFNTFAPHGRAPEIGETWNSQDHARTLEAIADSNAEIFYRGRLAEEIGDFSEKYGGFLSADDLARYYPEWVTPLKTEYRGYNIWELPPNGQGIITLIALNILKQFNINEARSTKNYHRQIEALKLAFADGKKHLTDPARMLVKTEELLSLEYGKKRSRLIGDYALTPEPGSLPAGGTVYLCTADGEGNMVSYIQSNYMGFGSGLVVPGTGIALQNRGHTFSLDPQQINHLEPAKRTYHTIIPGFITNGDRLAGAFGVMGGYMQPQGHLQVLMNLIDFKLNPQAALDAPRWMWVEGKEVLVEKEFPGFEAEALARKGHRIKVALESGPFGRGQIILRDRKKGLLMGGTEPRTDGDIACW